MSPFAQVLLALFGAALLGTVIGWCARRIVAVRDEKVLRETHSRELREVQGDLAASREENNALFQRNAELEGEVSENQRLNETIEASEQELRELRQEANVLQEQLGASNSKIKSLEETREKEAAERHAAEVSKVRADAAASHGRVNGQNDSGIDLGYYALGGVASGAVDLEVDDDIADLTSDLSLVLTPEMQRELAAEETPSSDDDAGPASGAVPVSASTSAPTSASASASDFAAGEGLFSRFNRKKKS